ncbi:MAG TPA: histidine phosphatase family protein [Pyrinomonadaceae bacterium]
MRTLYLLRHAKSSWKETNLADFDRPLSGRGRRATDTVGSFLKDEQITLDLVVSSPAVRARQTIELVLRAAKMKPELRFDERIYEATAARLLEVVSQLENDHKAVLLVGHNPGMQELLLLLTGQNEEYPTAALTKISFKNLKWAEVGNKKGNLEWIVKPKELEA